MNLYCYCNNDPVNYADPSGYFPWIAIIAIAAFVVGGGVLGGFYEGNIYNNIQGKNKEGQKISLSTGDRVKNILLGATLGLAVGGAAVILGAVGLAAVFGTTTFVAAVGGTALQIFVLGTLAFNLYAILSLMLTGVEIELLEWETKELPY